VARATSAKKIADIVGQTAARPGQLIVSARPRR
jgi:hypothetical protein